MSVSDQSESKWYAFYTKPRFEKKAHSHLIEKGYDSFLPLITTLRQWSDRKKKVQLPLLPSYVFVNCEARSFDEIYRIQGILNVVKHLGKPAIIQEYEIENLKILMTNDDDLNFINLSNVSKGDIVVVDKGPFQNLVAECIKLNGNHRIFVRISGVESAIEINIPISFVKKIDLV